MKTDDKEIKFILIKKKDSCSEQNIQKAKFINLWEKC